MHTAAQAGFHRIVFDAARDDRSNPCAQNRDPFDSIVDSIRGRCFPELKLRPSKQDPDHPGAKRGVHLIGHAYPGALFIPGLPLAREQRIRDEVPSIDSPARRRRAAPAISVRSTPRRGWSISTNLGPSPVYKLVTLAAGRDRSSRQVTKCPVPGRDECCRRRWQSIATFVVPQWRISHSVLRRWLGKNGFSRVHQHVRFSHSTSYVAHLKPCVFGVPAAQSSRGLQRWLVRLRSSVGEV